LATTNHGRKLGQCACGGGCPRCISPVSTGVPLSPGVRHSAEAQFGTDLSSVRIHTGPNAARLSEQRHANAVTLGRDIYFAHGRYAPETSEGRRILTHELAHTLQQRPGAAPASPTQARSAEQEAEAAAMTARLGRHTRIMATLATQPQHDDESGESPSTPSGTPSPDAGLDMLQSYMRWWLGIFLIEGAAPTSLPDATGGTGIRVPYLDPAHPLDSPLGLAPGLFPLTPYFGDLTSPLDPTAHGLLPDYAGILAPFGQRGLRATTGDLEMAETIFRQNAALVSILPDLRDLAPGFIRPLIPTDWRRSITVGLTSAAVANGLRGDYPTPLEAADQAYFNLTGIRPTYIQIPGIPF
jgi:hypothetical protein